MFYETTKYRFVCGYQGNLMKSKLHIYNLEKLRETPQILNSVDEICTLQFKSSL